MGYIKKTSWEKIFQLVFFICLYPFVTIVGDPAQHLTHFCLNRRTMASDV